MAISMASLLRERKYPFILAFFLLFVLDTFVIISNSQSPIPVPTGLNQNSSSPLNNGSPPDSGVFPNTTDSSVTNVNVSSGGRGNGDDDGVVDVEWELCNGYVSVDTIPCLENWKAIRAISRKRRHHMEHKERHCPVPSPRCLVPLPKGYKTPVPWPKSRDMIWKHNVLHPRLLSYKKDKRWVVESGDYLIFPDVGPQCPGDRTPFKGGVDKYIDAIEQTLPVIEWGKKTRVILDVRWSAASFGGSMLDRNVITMSFAPTDAHESPMQFALERGIPATVSIIGTQKLTYPDNSYDLIHCASSLVRFYDDGGKPLMELNRILRPGGYFIWSGTPVYRNDTRNQKVWKLVEDLSKAICWKVVKKTFLESVQVGVVIYQKPVSSSCYEKRKDNNPPICDQGSRLNNSWYSPMESCLAPLPPKSDKWPSSWPERLGDAPLSLSTEADIEKFKEDTTHWSALVSEVYFEGLGVNWSSVRNVMDMNAGYGGFAAALINQPLWVMNVVPIHEPDTLPVIFDRGLIGIYHDWCESFNTYPRTYDLLHASFLFKNLTTRCDVIEIAAEMDRLLRPGGYLIIQDTPQTIKKLNPILKSLHWSVNVQQGKFLVGKKDFWRPNTTG